MSSFLFSAWWPWFSVYSDTFFIQIIVIYLFILIFTSNNCFNVLLYLYFEIIYMGLILSLLQLDLFTGFLWVIEFIVVFIILLLFFYLNIEGFWATLQLSYFRGYYLFFVLNFFFFFFYFYFAEVENYVAWQLNITDFFENYYEALSNSSMNDFLVLMISYYSINSFEFICIAFLFLAGSIVCVNLMKITKNFKFKNIGSFLKLFNFFKNYVNYIFFRKQNLAKQSSALSATRLFKQKQEW